MSSAPGGATAEPQPARCRLYLITPPDIPDLEAFAHQLDNALAAGDVACVQLRLKGADDATIGAAVTRLMPVCHARDVAFILNDRPDLAAALGCDGVHIGPDDMPYDDARRLVGPGATVGVSAKNSRHRAMELAERGADYVAFGAFFPSPTKADTQPVDPDILEIWSSTTTVPCVAIGGITVNNCAPLVAAGADFLAVSSGVWSYPAGPAAAVAEFNRLFSRG
ncbi:MAG: thiamine phosphate synthase [Rhodospirillaceae bacterium]|nr:thiamine phosphate synthase [Rhodospirillaceae bacterium]